MKYFDWNVWEHEMKGNKFNIWFDEMSQIDGFSFSG